jgi:hypothetical protein
MEGCCEGSQGPPRTVELEIIIVIKYFSRGLEKVENPSQKGNI